MWIFSFNITRIKFDKDKVHKYLLVLYKTQLCRKFDNLVRLVTQFRYEIWYGSFLLGNFLMCGKFKINLFFFEFSFFFLDLNKVFLFRLVSIVNLYWIIRILAFKFRRFNFFFLLLVLISWITKNYWIYCRTYSLGSPGLSSFRYNFDKAFVCNVFVSGPNLFFY